MASTPLSVHERLVLTNLIDALSVLLGEDVPVETEERPLPAASFLVLLQKTLEADQLAG